MKVENSSSSLVIKSRVDVPPMSMSSWNVAQHAWFRSNISMCLSNIAEEDDIPNGIRL